MTDFDKMRDFKALWRDCGLTPQDVFEYEHRADRERRDTLCQEAQIKVFSCNCRSPWCPHCSKFCKSSETIRERLADLQWDRVRQVVLTVSRGTPADEAMEKIRKTRAIPKMIKNLGLKDRRWLWVLEFHADGYPHWHLFIENLRGKAGMIGKSRVQAAWKHGNVWESYPKDEKHWRATTGYHRKAGYFAAEHKAHQLTLPSYLQHQSRVRKFSSNFDVSKRSLQKKVSGNAVEGEKTPANPKPGKKRVQKPYLQRLNECNTTCKVQKGRAWIEVQAPGSKIREAAICKLDAIDYQTFQGDHESIIDFLIEIEDPGRADPNPGSDPKEDAQPGAPDTDNPL